METIHFLYKQSVMWFRSERCVTETDYYPGDEIFVEILSKEDQLPKRMSDPVYIYTVRNMRGETAVICEYIDKPLKIANSMYGEQEVA